MYYTGSNCQAPDFETKTEFLINHIKGEFNYGNDIAKLLRELKYIDIKLWYPTLKIKHGNRPSDKIGWNKTIRVNIQSKIRCNSQT